MFPKKHARQLSLVFCCAGGTDVSRANRTVDVSRPCAALLRPTPTIPWYFWVLDSAGSYFCAEQLISSQQKVFPSSGGKAANDLHVNRLLFSPVSLQRIPVVHALDNTFRTTVFHAMQRNELCSSLGRPIRLCPMLLRPGLSTPCCNAVTPRLDLATACQILKPSGHLSNPKPGHTTGGSGQSARRNGRAGSGKIRCQQKSSPRKQKFTVPPKASKNNALTSLQKHEQAKSYVNRRRNNITG